MELARELVRNLSACYEWTEGAAAVDVESGLACLLAWSMSDRLAALNGSSKAGYSISREKKWLGVATLHEKSGLVRDDEESPAFVAFESIESSAGLVLRAPVRISLEELLGPCQVAESAIPASIHFVRGVVRGVSTAVYRSLLGNDCDQPELVCRSLDMPDHRVLLETPWTHGGTVEHGQIHVWAPPESLELILAWLRRRIDSHDRLQDQYMALVGLPDSSGMSGDTAVLVGGGGRPLRLVEISNRDAAVQVELTATKAAFIAGSAGSAAVDATGSEA